jgi:hypothetical protein
MIKKILLPLLLTASFFFGCGSDIRPDSYVTQQSMLLTRDNIAHSRINLIGDRLGVITFSKERFNYKSEFISLSGTWESEFVDVVSNGDSVSVINSITYTGDDDSEYTTYFISNNDYELNVGDTFILTGDQILSGTVARIERSNIY